MRYETIPVEGYERVTLGVDDDAGLRAIIAIHSRRLGPALGATRLWPYPDDAAALKDALRLSRGMTFKAACAGLRAGGGKAVIIARPEAKSDELLRAYGRFVESLGGDFVTGTDVNTTGEDMAIVRRETRHVLNKSASEGGAGDTGVITALGVLHGMRAATELRLGRGLRGLRVAVQGVGKVGAALCGLLRNEGAELFVTDSRPEVARGVAEAYGARVVAPQELFGLDVDVFAPCALGGILDETTIPQLRCAVIAGAANNQLADEIAGARLLHGRGITYCPDFVVNAGGLIAVAEELWGTSGPGVLAKVTAIAETMRGILDDARRRNIPPPQAALELAAARLQAAREVQP